MPISQALGGFKKSHANSNLRREGIPTVVPGPKKSPRAPAGTGVVSRGHRLRNSASGSKQKAVTLGQVVDRRGRAKCPGMKLLPGLLRSKRFERISMKGVAVTLAET